MDTFNTIAPILFMKFAEPRPAETAFCPAGGMLFLKDAPFKPATFVPHPSLKKKRQRKKRKRIRCPACGWQPDGKPHWQCERCFATFDTFKTRARCPNQHCGNCWHLTQCIRCGILSPHEEWYVEEEEK